jgi:hypothetical protein
MNRPYRLGGISFIVVGILFLTKYAVELSVGPPPSDGAEILAWVAANELLLALGNEILFFAAAFLIPAVITLYWSLAGVDRTTAATGSGVFAAVIPTIFVLLIVQGRLVYPIYGLHVDTPAVAELVVAVYYGGLHAVALLFGLGTIVLSVAMRRGVFGRNVALLGVAACVFDVLSSYPETVGPLVILVSQALFAGWCLAVGSKLFGVRDLATRPSMLASAEGSTP